MFVLKIEIMIAFFYYYLLLGGLKYVNLKLDSVFYLLAQARLYTFHLIHCGLYNFGCRLKKFNIDASEID